MVKRISWREYEEFNRSLYPRDNSLRVGQKFLNEKFPSVADPDLFYCTDEDTCHLLIMANYVREVER